MIHPVSHYGLINLSLLNMGFSGSRQCCWSLEISIPAKSTALMQLCLSFKAMMTERSTLGKIYFPESHSINSAIIPCLLAQVLEQQPLNSQPSSSWRGSWRKLNAVQRALAELALAWMMLAKGTFKPANHTFLKKKPWFSKLLWQPSNSPHHEKVYWLYETVPPDEPPQNNLKHTSILIIFPVLPSCHLISPRIWSALAG